MPDFFDRLIDEIVGSAPVAATHAQSHAAMRPARLRRLVLARPRSRRLLLGVALLCLPAVGGLALAGTFAGPTISPQEWVDGKRVQPETGLTPAQTANLGILRRLRVASDDLPPGGVISLTHTPMAASGANPSLSRRVAAIASGAAWVIPGNGTVCLIADNAQALAMASRQPVSGTASPPASTRVPGASSVMSCATDSEAAKGWSAGTAGSSESPGVVYTAGIVPDGVSNVTVSVAGGSSMSLPVYENVYAAEVHGWPASVSFTGPAGPVTLSNGSNVLAHFATGAKRPRSRKP